MNHGELFRRWLTAAFNIAAITMILLMMADQPARAVLCFVAWKLALEGVVWTIMRKQGERHGRIYSSAAPAVAVATACLAFAMFEPPVDHVDRRPGESTQAFLYRAQVELPR